MSDIDWHNIFLSDFTYTFLMEVVFRTAIMFVVVLVILRLSGKRGVRQLSVFELVIILSLGSAAGDPMLYQEVAILPALMVCITTITLYRLITWLTTKYGGFENLLEGRPVYIVEEGVMVIKESSKDSLSKDEFFAELREKGVEHLGQVKTAILETSGTMSVFYYPDDEVKPGLPILPKAYDQHHAHVTEAGLYACAYCGTVSRLPPGRHKCKRCSHHGWAKAIASKRIT